MFYSDNEDGLNEDVGGGVSLEGGGDGEEADAPAGVEVPESEKEWE